MIKFVRKRHIILNIISRFYKGETIMNHKSKNFYKVPELLINRVYIRLGNNYNILTREGLSSLICAVAENHPVSYGITLCEIYPDSRIYYPKRAKHFILQEIDNFIYGINQRKAHETMATYTSLNQITHINNFLLGHETDIPAYTAVILYVIFILLPSQSPNRIDCKKILNQIHNVIHSYYLYNPDDELARFFEDSFTLVINAMDTNNDSLCITDFPSIPREHPKDYF